MRLDRPADGSARRTSSLDAHQTIWVDVEDLFKYFSTNPHPSGIQRLVFEILGLLPERAKLDPELPRIGFVRHAEGESLLREVTLDSVVQLFATRSGAVAALAPHAATPMTEPEKPAGKGLRLTTIGYIERLPPGIAEPLLQAGVLQLTVLRYARALAKRLARKPEGAGPQAAPVSEITGAGFAGQPGDVLLVLGAPWIHPDYAGLLRQVRAKYRLSPALLLYDLIPIRRPEWCAGDLVSRFLAWFTATVPQCERLMAISRATAADVEAYAGEAGIALAARVQPIPLGTGFGGAIQRMIAAETRPLGLPTPGSYVLFVSTLEARKNHVLLFRVWRRLLSELPREQVPTLVFAGRVGWLVTDLLQQLENTDWLSGKLRLLRDPTDAELAALYRGCQFTLFPSLYEGWGLPVSESLALGCPCITSNRTSLPEAGGALARYFNPEDLDDACRAIRAVIEDPAELETWRDRVRRDFQIRPWEDTADAILTVCSSAPAGLLVDKAP